MSLPAAVRRRVEQRVGRFCRERFPAHRRGDLRLDYVIEGTAVTLVEVRPSNRNQQRWSRRKVAQCRYSPDSDVWSLYWKDERGRWQSYSRLEPTSNLEAVLGEIAGDPRGLFWR